MFRKSHQLSSLTISTFNINRFDFLMSWYKLISPLFAIILLTQCSSTKNQYLVEEIPNLDSDFSISLLLIDSEAFFDEFPDHTFGALRPGEASFFERELLNIFSSQTSTPVIGLHSAAYLSPDKFNVREFNTEENSVSLVAPTDGEQVSREELESRFVVILDQYYFTPFQTTVGGSSYAGHEGETENRVLFEFSYVIWDNSTESAIAWGSIANDTLLRASDPEQSYRSVLIQNFRQLIRHSPFDPIPANV